MASKPKGELPVFYPKDRPTEKQRQFVHLYLTNGRSAPHAYMTMRGATELTENHRVTGYRLLKHPKVKKLLAEAENTVHQKTVKVFEKYAITEERVLEELARIAFSNHTDVISWNEDGVAVKNSADLTEDAKSAIAEITEIETKSGKKVKIKMADKRAALETLAKHLGLLTEKHEHKHLAVQFVIEK